MKTEGASENTNYENENKLQALEPMWRLSTPHLDVEREKKDGARMTTCVFFH